MLNFFYFFLLALVIAEVIARVGRADTDRMEGVAVDYGAGVINTGLSAYLEESSLISFSKSLIESTTNLISLLYMTKALYPNNRLLATWMLWHNNARVFLPKG